MKIWKIPDKDGNMIELKNIRPWKELSISDIQSRGSDLPLSGALSINDYFKESYTGDEGPFKANDIATLLEQSTLEPPTDNLSGQVLKIIIQHVISVVDYNNRVNSIVNMEIQNQLLSVLIHIQKMKI